MPSDLTLERAIEQQIVLGYKDPHTFPDLLKRALGDELVELAMPHLDDFIAEMARQRLNTLRRASVARITSTTVGDAETMTRSLWVPTQDGQLLYKRIGDMSAADFEARAEYLDKMIHGIRTHAQWCRDCAARMLEEKVRKASKLSALPPLPEIT